ncbi:rab-GTPase-TBC domain-containing protein [Crucibulum laeve]|uniref:Rab-GTPase-TBC domain-containing protein n=1 Tax=Crucibulum laeve TaxID=68775 RepID=A0A5C3M281_9AGAR|nr:rab-GTPase-TBC domain-containing protein [Crucibulum laeve]
MSTDELPEERKPELHSRVSPPLATIQHIQDKPESKPHFNEEKLNWEELRKRSIQPGGFGSERVDIWPRLLNASAAPVALSSNHDVGDETKHLSPETNDDHTEEKPHPDERQIRLDTDRSFVLYPVGLDSDVQREKLQGGLHELLVSLIRKRPKLSYFQGYHDIITVLFLTLPPELRLSCAEKFSLHRVRDSMGSSLEPVLGLLRITKNLIRVVDPDYADILERTTPLPFHALSNILTLFSHDMPTLPLIQHVFDFQLCRPPIVTVYLAAAIILSRKQEVIRLEEEGEEGMIHSLLSSLPDIVDMNEGDIVKQHVVEDVIKRVDVKIETVENTLDDQKAVGKIEIHEEVIQEKVKQNDESPEVKAEEEAKLEKTKSSPEIPSPRSPSSDSLPPWSISHKPRTPSPDPIPPKPPIPLSVLLAKADELFATYPPTHPDLALSKIMGPQSVVYTWSESNGQLPLDDDAEAMVSHPELVVYPFVEGDEEVESDSGKDEDSSYYESEKKNKGKEKRKRRKLRKPFPAMSLRRSRIEKRTMLAGAVLVLGVAMAVYGVKTRSVNPRDREQWRMFSGWVGGALVGAGSKLVHGLTGTGKG